MWTDGRAATLDNLDAKISSRAQASTALSNTTWTNTRAGYLDYLANATYGLPALYNLMSINGGIPGTVKSTQRGNLGKDTVLSTDRENNTNYIDITISAVNINKAVVLVNASNGSKDDTDRPANARLLNATTLRVYANYVSAGQDTGTMRNVNWQVVDFY